VEEAVRQSERAQRHGSRDFWIEEHERAAIVEFHENNPLEGYRRLTFMMLDQDVVAVSPAACPDARPHIISDNEPQLIA
jgi:hypothetical protein